MKGRMILAGSVLMLLMAGSPSSLVHGAGPIPSPFRGVTVAAVVRKDERTGIFTYLYRVSNPAINDGLIWSIDIEITQGPNDAVLSRTGLVNGPGYDRVSSEDASRRISMVPVGIDGPPGWDASLGSDSHVPLRGVAGWARTESAELIGPGQSREGFRLTSYGLPGIRIVEVEPEIDYANLPDEFADAQKARQLRDSLIFFTKTVGPKAPPKDFVPLEFLNYLITLVRDSRQLGWIKVDGVQQSLLAKLLNAKRKLEAGDIIVAKNMLNAFLHEVQGASCPEFTCPGNKPLTSEAFALLFFNGQFLVERLR